MTILYICSAELLRAYTCRSQRVSLYSMGFFSNRYMHISVLLALGLTWFLALVPPFQQIFGMTYLSDIKGYGLVAGLAFVPALVDEITKWVLRTIRFGESQGVKTNHIVDRVSSVAINVAPSSRYNMKTQN